ncbi:hypothetical protein RM530_14985 [Algiphilus sp. W345]|uniref:Cupin domain-containing protein n=1 Tax=Banduia mediterranea TaxID=3075609 RepID=A0ABU2WL94_9GAMM|nr:hypothetical protein [Algiphilus sp. W345]MDT0498653.1 hypothetical protein [Algiphilus sp. W345]
MRRTIGNDGAAPPVDTPPPTPSVPSRDSRPLAGDEEQVQAAVPAGVRIERIVSHGQQTSPPGFWYDQEEGAFVLLLAGKATLSLQVAERRS